MKNTKKDYDPKVVGITLFKFFYILKDCIIEQEGKIGWISHCICIKLDNTLNGIGYDKNNKQIDLHKKHLHADKGQERYHR